MKSLKDTGLLFQRHFTQQMRNPTWLFVGLSSPVLYLALFTPPLKHFTRAASTGAVLDSFFPGILALLAFASGSAQGFGTIFELRSGVIERLRVTPASRFAILAGPLVSAMTFMYFFDAIAAGRVRIRLPDPLGRTARARRTHRGLHGDDVRLVCRDGTHDQGD